MNIQWRLRFQEALVAHLSPFKSDHIPLLIKFDTDARISRRRRPFHFTASWPTHSDFTRFMQRNWKPSLPWNVQMKDLKDALE